MNWLKRRGLNTFATVLALTVVALFSLVLAKPSHIAAQSSPLGEKVEEKYVIVARNNLGMHCYGPDFSDFVVLRSFNTLWAQDVASQNPYLYQLARITARKAGYHNTSQPVLASLAVVAPVSTEIRCASCHCDTCVATMMYPIHPIEGVKTNILTLYDFLNEGQYAPLLMTQRPVL